MVWGARVGLDSPQAVRSGALVALTRPTCSEGGPMLSRGFRGAMIRGRRRQGSLPPGSPGRPSCTALRWAHAFPGLPGGQDPGETPPRISSPGEPGPAFLCCDAVGPCFPGASGGP